MKLFHRLEPRTSQVELPDLSSPITPSADFPNYPDVTSCWSTITEGATRGRIAQESAGTRLRFGVYVLPTFLIAPCAEGCWMSEGTSPFSRDEARSHLSPEEILAAS